MKFRVFLSENAKDQNLNDRHESEVQIGICCRIFRVSCRSQGCDKLNSSNCCVEFVVIYMFSRQRSIFKYLNRGLHILLNGILLEQ